MGRVSKKIGPLFPIEEPKSEIGEGEDKAEEPKEFSTDKVEKKEDRHPQEVVLTDSDPDGLFSKYKKKQPKYKTHVAHNVRIPRELRKEIDAIAKKLGVSTNRNSGFLQQFTIDALKIHVEKAKKELDLE